jgi:hypothetical protein
MYYMDPTFILVIMALIFAMVAQNQVIRVVSQGQKRLGRC